MAKLRNACSYRRVKRPYTRISKFRKKSYVRMDPNIKIVRFDMGDPKKKFHYKLTLHSKTILQIRQEAIESARQISNRILETKLGKTGFSLKIKIYPHHVLRQKAFASGAGADRTSTGMSMPYGKPVGVAAQIRRKGKELFEVHVDEPDIQVAKKALKEASYKLPCPCQIKITKIA